MSKPTGMYWRKGRLEYQYETSTRPMTQMEFRIGEILKRTFAPNFRIVGQSVFGSPGSSIRFPMSIGKQIRFLG